MSDRHCRQQVHSDDKSHEITSEIRKLKQQNDRETVRIIWTNAHWSRMIIIIIIIHLEMKIQLMLRQTISSIVIRLPFWRSLESLENYSNFEFQSNSKLLEAIGS